MTQTVTFEDLKQAFNIHEHEIPAWREDWESKVGESGDFRDYFEHNLYNRNVVIGGLNCTGLLHVNVPREWIIDYLLSDMKHTLEEVRDANVRCDDEGVDESLDRAFDVVNKLKGYA